MTPHPTALQPDAWNLLEQSHDPVMVTDRDGRILYVNPAFEQVSGYSRQEAVGQTPRLLKSGWHDAAFYEALWQTILAGRAFQALFVNRKKNGELYWAEQVITPIRDAQGQVTHFLSVWRDVTARQQAEAERKRLTAILENTSDFVAIAHPDGRVQWYNRAARRMLGLADDEDIRSIRIPDTHPEWAARLVMEQGIPTAIREGIWRGETALLSRDGREIPVSQVILAHKGPGGQVEYLSTIARDIAEERKLQAAITRALTLERALRRIDLVLLQERPLPEVLEVLCDGVVALGFRLCWVGLKEPDFTVRPVASRGLEDGYLQAVQVRWDEASPLGRGPEGTAARTGKSVVVPDCATDPSFEPWREQALRRGYRSAAAVPLTTDHQVLGIVAVYSERTGAFDEAVVRSLETLAQQGTLAILTARQREELRRIQQLEDFHVEHMPLAHILWDLDFRVVRWNRSAERIFGWRAEEVLGRSAWEFLVPPEARAQVHRVWEELRSGARHSHSINPNYRRDGTRILCEWFNTALKDAAGQVVGVASMAQDISEMDRLRAHALEEKQRFQDLAEATAEAILIADPQGRITYANPAAERLFGLSEADIRGRPLQSLLPSAPERVGRWEGKALRAGGEAFPVEGSVSQIAGLSGVFRTYVVRDLTERKRFEEQLAYLANHDPLTGLFNRRRLREELERQLAHARRYGETGALLFVDLDGFKEVNDNLGHQAGDEVLASVASFLRTCLRETDVAGRLGGDEFGILLPRAGEEEARAVAQRILQGLRLLNPVVGGQPVRITASVGIVLLPTDGSSVDELLVLADAAMYQAKDAGGDRLCVGGRSRPGGTPAATRIAWERRIRRALETEAFVLHVQPILDLRTQRISQYELLVRMVDEQGEAVPPREFLGVAERTGLIHSIDRWVIRQAVRLIDAWAAKGHDLRLEVNLSGRAFEDSELLPLIRRELGASRARPDNLVLEITETAAIRDIHQARAFVNDLKELGCRFALDDFGVGFGSFYYLKYLPVDFVKIDGAFIRSLRDDPVDPRVVKAIVEVAAGLGIRTVAECVEDEDTLQLLRQYGVDYAQGFHIGRPVPVSQLRVGE